MTGSYGERLRTAVARYGPLCVGIDPHPGVLDRWDLPRDAYGLERCARTMIEAVAGRVAIVKPQSAFFEAYGSAGIAVLELLISDAREAGVLVLLDVKRGDIGSTMDAYTAAYLTDGSSLAVDAMTASPFLGPGSLDGAIAQAERSGRGVYVLAATSNPEGVTVQQAASPEGGTISQAMIDFAAGHNADAAVRGEWGSVGVVVGATIDPGTGLDFAALNGSILAPGLGTQGGTADDLRKIFGDAYPLVIPSNSRGILNAGPGVAGIRAAVEETQQSLG
ncbi:orotidine 5'-phosphate decarboxylase [Microlunatus endophyticus]|uniref:Orotidine-5'-phosphate decarboxylase n=1 Tax=Microlunatus endophyticus TaxID=1716077 RepID=A0A917S2M6_9ACTN|nr:orotidine-5'-phosphate decarboxylase [Microlunatus endophyticus]GGL53062.1 orotidine 5'-phosphate decarboxylase [Microlunatus endophyticus]